MDPILARDLSGKTIPACVYSRCMSHNSPAISHSSKFSSWLFLTALALAFPVANARSQTLAKIRVGDSSANLNSLGSDPIAQDSYKSFTVRKWLLSAGDEFSATAEPSGRLRYIELDWGGKSTSLACDLSGITFGVTTLTDIRKRFGSNGFGFQDRGGVADIPDGVVMLNSYEIGNMVVTFYTKVLRDLSLSAADSTLPVADRAKLDAISIADTDYATSEWGQRIYDPAYKKAEWK